MTFYLAAFDPAHSSAGGNYWTWKHPHITQRLLDSLYYSTVAKNLPKNPNQLKDSDFHGGIVALDEEWACGFQIVNGGRDSNGRPGRFVLFAAFSPREQRRDADYAALFQSPAFRQLITNVRNVCPIPEPAALAIDLDSPPPRCDSALHKKILTQSTISLSSERAFEDAAALAADLSTRRNFTCLLTRHNNITNGSFAVGRENEPAPVEAHPAARSPDANPAPPQRLSRTVARPLSGAPRVVALWLAAAIAIAALLLGTLVGFAIGEYQNAATRMVAAESKPSPLPSIDEAVPKKDVAKTSEALPPDHHQQSASANKKAPRNSPSKEKPEAITLPGVNAVVPDATPHNSPTNDHPPGE